VYVEALQLARSGRPVNGTILHVVVPRPLRRVFDYALPDNTAPPDIGSRVWVPFAGSNVVGIVTGTALDSTHNVKNINEIIDKNPILPADLIELAGWLSRYYHHPLGEVYATMLPQAARRGASFKLTWPVSWEVTTTNNNALERAPRQKETFDILCRAGSAVPDIDIANLDINRRALKALEKKGLVKVIYARPEYRTKASPLSLNVEQRAAISAITDTLNKHVTHVLDGVTGSGKTEVYMQAIASVLGKGRQALVLVPEIALTPQTLRRFRERFGAAASLHSAVPDHSRFDTWMKCRTGHHKILIGTRSAVFAPFCNLGLIIVDEEHDSSFKQQEGLRYSARDVAIKRAQLLDIPVVLGSATPSLETLANVNRNRYLRAQLTNRAGGASMPTYNVIDIRGKRLNDGMSEELISTIDTHLTAGNQALVFINRRGFAPTCMCANCGWQAYCVECDARLTLHDKPQGLRCHHCDRRYHHPETCPNCKDTSLIALGTGTQRIDRALSDRFPNIPLYRIDRDTTRSEAKLNAQLGAIREGLPAILVGTQMLAKGHHLPAVTLVAVIDTDTGFLSADFRAPERTAQLITQVAGRAGRAERAGQVWIQTFDPQNANLRALIEHGYPGFARTEAKLRRDAELPPHSAMAILRSESTNRNAAANLLQKAASFCSLANRDLQVMGPVPAPMPRRNSRFRYQCMLLSRKRRALHETLSALENEGLSARNVRWSIDVDPLDTF
jgi:primosomal protein N' (replication factor Y)